MAAFEENDSVEIKEKEDGHLSGLLFFIAFLLLLILSGAYYAFSKADPYVFERTAKPEETIHLTGKDGLYFMELPPFRINLNDKRQNFSVLRTSIALEMNKPSDKKDILAVMPRIQDSIMTYLREIRPEELQESGGLYLLKEALLERINYLIAPAHINDVLFKEMFVEQRN